MALSKDNVDTTPSFIDGMNEGLDSTLIKQTQTRRNINVTLRNGAISPRPRYYEVSLSYSGSESKPTIGAASYEEILRKGRIQHAGKFQTSTQEVLILVLSGVIFKVDVETGCARVIEVEGTQKFTNYKCRRINGHQAEKYYVLYDWPSQPIIIDDTCNARRTDSENLEIPRSHIGTFVHNRTFPGSGIEFAASDPVGPVDPTNSLDLNPPITFYESFINDNNLNPQFAESASYSLSYIEKTSGITAMGYFQATDGDTGLGYGPLFVSTKESIHLFPVNRPRSTWETQQFGTVQVFNYGIIGQKAHVNVGGDLYYRSCDGHIYSLKRIYGDQQTGAYRHISKAIECSLLTKNKHLLKYSAMGYFDNRIFTTLRPFIIESIDPFGNCIEDVVFNGLGVLELSPVNELNGSSNDVWASLYTGYFSCMEEVGNEYYLIGKNKNSGYNQLIKLDEDRSWDYIGKVSTPVRSRVYSREYDFNNPLVQKNLKSIQENFKDIKPPFKASVYYRTDSKCEWDCLGDIVINCEDDKCDTRDEFLCPNSGDFCFKSMEIRVDICGIGYNYNRENVVADIHSEIDTNRILDGEIDPCLCEDTENLGDLCL